MSLRYIDGQEPWKKSDRIEGVRFSLKHLLALESPALEALGLEPIPVPEPVVTPPSTDPNDYPLQPFQFFAMLEIMGETMDPVVDLEAHIEAVIGAIPDTNSRAVARAKYKHTTSFHRDNPLFAQIAPSIGLTDAQIDTAWMQAKEIV